MDVHLLLVFIHYTVVFIQKLKNRVHTEMVELPLIHNYQQIKIDDGKELVLSGFNEAGQHCVSYKKNLQIRLYMQHIR